MSSYAFIETTDGTPDGPEKTRICYVGPVRLLTGEIKDPANVVLGDMIPSGLGFTLCVNRIDVTE
jgi:hypothetical protein